MIPCAPKPFPTGCFLGPWAHLPWAARTQPPAPFHAQTTNDWIKALVIKAALVGPSLSSIWLENDALQETATVRSGSQGSALCPSLSIVRSVIAPCPQCPHHAHMTALSARKQGKQPPHCWFQLFDGTFYFKVHRLAVIQFLALWTTAIQLDKTKYIHGPDIP